MTFWDKFNYYWSMFGMAAGVAGIIVMAIFGPAALIGRFVLILVVSLGVFARARRIKLQKAAQAHGEDELPEDSHSKTKP